MSVILEAKHISKNFGLTQALKDVSVTIDEGEVMSCLKWARTTVLKIQLQDMENKLLL